MCSGTIEAVLNSNSTFRSSSAEGKGDADSVVNSELLFRFMLIFFGTFFVFIFFGVEPIGRGILVGDVGTLRESMYRRARQALSWNESLGEHSAETLVRRKWGMREGTDSVGRFGVEV